MAKSDRRSRDQKRKAKLKKRAERGRKHESLAYHGNTYKTDEFVPIFVRTETGIYEAYVMSDRALTDDAVEAALERLVVQMRQGPLPPLTETMSLSLTEGGEVDLIAANIRRNWQIFAEEQPLPRREDLIGILRTILHSLEIWRSQSMHSRGYLHYLEGFMKKVGVSVRMVTSDLEPIPEPEDDPLLVLGRSWIDEGDEDAAQEFQDRVESLLRDGDAERVIEVCQQLLGETDPETDEPSIVPRLQALALLGHRALKTGSG